MEIYDVFPKSLLRALLLLVVAGIIYSGINAIVVAIVPQPEHRMSQEERMDAQRQQWNANGQADYLRRQKGE